MLSWLLKLFRGKSHQTKKTEEEITQPVHSDSEKAKIEHDLATIGCPMSKDEFAQFIIPLLLRYPHTSVGYDIGDAGLLYKYSGTDAIEKRDAYELLRWKHHDLILQTACMLRRNFEILMGAGVLGRNVSISTQENCCLSIFNDRTVNTLELISAYDNPDGDYPLFPPIETPCVYQDGAYKLCNVWISTVNNNRRSHGDHNFAAYLDDHFGKAHARGNLPWIDNWRDVLVGERNKLLREQIIDINEDLERYGNGLEELNNSVGTPPTAEMLSKIGMQELRSLQKKYGIRGHRTMLDIAAQFITFEPAQKEIQEIVDSIRAREINSHIEEAKRCFSHIKQLEDTIKASNT